WEAMRRSIFYWTRVFVAVAPAHIRWWPNRAAMEEGQPNEWRAPPGAIYPQSDPAPPGKMSAPPAWPQSTWQDRSDQAMNRGKHAHLTLCDDEGFPIPLRVRDVSRCEEGFRMEVPKAAPWSAGKATLSFQGVEIFIGEASPERGQTLVRVERSLPDFPLAT